MLCERCGKREATVNVVCVVNDTRVSKWLCESCAKEFAAEGVLAGQKGESARNILEEIFKPLRRLAEKNYYEESSQKDHFYTDLAEKILAAARRTAVQRQQEEIGTEHILWAMLQEPESQAAHLLLRCGVDKYTLLGELETWMGKTVEGANPVTYTKEASSAMHYAKSFSDADGLYLTGSGHILLGLLAGWIPRVREVLIPISNVIMLIPPLMFSAYLIMIMATFRDAAIAVIFFAVFWPTFQGMVARVGNIDPAVIEAARTMGVGTIGMLFKVIMPYCLPEIIKSISKSLRGAFMCLAGAEMLGINLGIGYFIEKYKSFADYRCVMAGIVTVGVITTTIDIIVNKVKSGVIRWQE